MSDIDIDKFGESIPKLLSGLKTAFFTSVLGLALSTWIKSRNAIRNITEKVPKDSVDSLLFELKKLNKSLTGDEDLTILTQIQKFRLSMDEKFKTLEVQIQNISEQLNIISRSKDQSTSLGQIINLLEELNRISGNLHVVVTLAPELQAEFMKLIENNDSLIDVVGGNVEKIEKIYDSVARKTKDGVLINLRNINDTIKNLGKDIGKEDLTVIKNKIENISNYFEIIANSTNRRESYFDILEGIEKIRAANYKIIDELRRK